MTSAADSQVWSPHTLRRSRPLRTGRTWDNPDSDQSPPWRGLLVERLLRQTAQRSPNAVAMVEADQTTSYRELDMMADRAASGLARLGLRQGDVVALSAGNSPETLAVMFGASRAGLIVLPINRMNTDDEIQYQMREADAVILLSPESGHGPSAEELIASGEPDTPPRIDVDETSPFWVRFTSGTTGRPKGYAMSHRAVTLMAHYAHAEFHYRSDDTLLVNAPLAHAAFAFATAIVATGGAMALSDFDPERIWLDCDRYGATQLFLVPTMLAMSLSSEGSASTVRQITVAGSALLPSLKERAAKRLPHVQFAEMYGASEVGMFTALHSHEAAGRVGSVGLPRFGYSLRVLDDNGRQLPAGEVGTIYVQGPSMSDGPIGGTVESEHRVRDGWVTPGDMGWLDDDGFLYLADRRSDLIVSGGLNVYPAEVENVLQQVDEVGEVVVVGIADDVWGQRVTAVLTGGVPEHVLDEHCRKLLSGYKIPRQYIRVEELPKTPTGKVKRAAVRDLVAERQPNGT